MLENVYKNHQDIQIQAVLSICYVRVYLVHAFFKY